MKKTLYWIFIVVSLLSLSGVSCANEERKIENDLIFVKDVLGRELLIPKIPRRIVIGDHYWETFIVGGDSAFNNVVGWSATTWVKWRNSIYEEFAQAVPRLRVLEDVGLTFDQTFDVEKFLSLNPDLFVLPVYQSGRERTVRYH